ENGKFVFPASLEEDIRLNPYIENAMVYGENRPYNVCIVVPDFAVLGRYAREHGLPEDPKELVERPEIHDLVAREVTQALTGKYGGYEIPRKFIILSENFSVEDGTLTQTLKVKRRVVIKRLQEKIDALYRTS
ncbi:MAG TPA: long-chain fatty acid--CoA ligase, partial [Deltaproteobacteria bacterium]|nr:long-chain fatty acid--CoA ligase [Deltaproteobacteria bacterium]